MSFFTDELFQELSVTELEDRLELVDRCNCRNFVGDDEYTDRSMEVCFEL